MYDKAAEKLEQYARHYAGEKDASDAMSDAIFFRKALGDRAKAIEDTEYFIKTYSARRPDQAANASWSLTALYESDPAAAITHLKSYLRMFGMKGDDHRVVLAYAKLGALLWSQSCPHALIDGLCVSVTERAPRTCGKGTTRTLSVTPRRDPTRTRALEAFAHAVAYFERRAGAVDAAARYYYAQAKLAQADSDLEAYLAIAFPRGLSFDPAQPEARDTSRKRFSEWIDAKRKAGAIASRKYEAVVAVKDVVGSITAASRLGTISQAFASELVTSTPARDLATGRAAYCDAMTEVAAPLEASAVAGFTTCLQKSTELGWFGDSSAHCERQLFELEPAEFPRARELRIKPLLAAPVIDVEPPGPSRTPAS
jgi:hypothetical protein